MPLRPGEMEELRKAKTYQKKGRRIPPCRESFLSTSLEFPTLHVSPGYYSEKERGQMCQQSGFCSSASVHDTAAAPGDTSLHPPAERS